MARQPAKKYRGKHETQNLSPGCVARAGRWFGGWIDLKPLYRMVAVGTGRNRGNRCGPNAARQKNQKASQGLNRSRAEDLEDVMALLERVSTLIRANLNDLIDKAENPEKLVKQVILDMQNQLMQVKTQVAIAIADQHVLEKKRKENADKETEGIGKAELDGDKKQ